MSAKIDFVIGGSGTGKSAYLRERFADEAVRNPDKKYIMIVPEQAASTVERDMVKIMSLRHGKIGFMNIDIIGISRLSYKIFDELSEKVEGLMSDAGKSMLIRLVAGRTDLRLYKNSIDKEGFISETKSLLSELFQYNISMEDIEKLIAELEKTGENPFLFEKLSDMAAIYKGFEEKLEKEEDGVIPAEKTVAYLLQKLGDKKCSILDDAVIAFDGFTGYTPSQYSLIEELLKRAERMTFAITMDASIIRSGRDVKDYELFYLSYVTYVKICALAEKYGKPVNVKNISENTTDADRREAADIILMTDNKRHNKGTMLHTLEERLFRVPVKPYEGGYYTADNNGGNKKAGREKTDGEEGETRGNFIRLWECRDPEEQLSCIAQEIRRKIKEEGYRYSDIAVLAPNLEEMSGSFDKIFEMYDIPFFPDYTRKLRSSPFTEAILFLLNCEEKNYDFDSFFSLLKTGVVEGAGREEISLLENYAATKNLRGFRRWNRSFSYIENNTDRYEAEEAARKQIMKSIAAAHESFTGGDRTVKNYTDAVRGFMAENRFEEKSEEAAGKLELDGDFPLAATYRSLFNRVSLFLDMMENMLGEVKVSLREFSDIFKAGISEIRIGTIPAVIDSVTVGDIERTRVSDVKVIFLINANDGIIPKPGKPAKILSDKDKDTIEVLFDRLGIRKELAPNEKKSLYIEQFYLYLCMTKPVDELIISKCRMSMGGEELEGSYILSRLRSIFPKLEFEKRKPESFKGTEKTDVYFFSEMVRNTVFEDQAEAFSDEDAAVLYALFRDKKNMVDKAAGYRTDDDHLSQDAIDTAASRLMVQSVSKLENYSECEYRFFLNYMLKLRQRDSDSIDSLKYGNILHGALEGVFREMDRKEPQETYLNWTQTGDDDLCQKMRKAIDTQFRTVSDEFLAADGTIIAGGRDRFIMNEIYALGDRTIRTLAFHIRGGRMAPRYYEDKFDLRDKLETTGIEIPGQGKKLKLTGKIDRADIYESGDNVYLRIIDYKTGDKEFSYNKLLNGTQLQLSAYLAVMIEKVRTYYERAGRKVNVIPVGMYYYPVKDPDILRTDELNDDNIEEEKRKYLRLKGITTTEPEYQELQEKGISDPDRKNNVGEILPIEYYVKATNGKQAGDIKGVHVALSEDEFRMVTDFTELKIREITGNMFKGNITKNPVKSGSYTSCDYCGFKDVCRFDPINRNNRAKRLAQNFEEDAFEEIRTQTAIYRGESTGEQNGASEQ